MSKVAKKKPGKLGRNDSCFCGSGIKYKKCCLTKKIEMTPAIEELHAQMQRERQGRQIMLIRHGIYTNIPNIQNFKGKTMLACGTRVTWVDREHATFHELILANLRHEVGDAWFDAERQKPTGEQHYIVRSALEFDEYVRSGGIKPRQEANGQISAIASGYVQSVLSLAFDLYLLRHKGCIDQTVVDRLRDRHEYQGARYEIAVASIFARADCRIEWIAPTPKQKTAEFTAHCPLTANSVIVEAKSKRPRGVLHEEGDFNFQKALKIGKLPTRFHDALQKDTQGLPYLIFLDVNAPYDLKNTADSLWLKEIQNMMAREHTPTATDPDIYNEVVITNFAPHYDEDRAASPGQIAFCKPLYAAQTLKDEQTFFGRIHMAASEYGYVPSYELQSQTPSS